MRPPATPWQWLILGAFWLSGEAVVRTLHWPVPGSVAGFAGLLLCLLLGWLPVSWVQAGSSTLLKHLSLFFVPAMLAVIKYKELVSLDGLKLVMATMLGTLAVMVGTALLVEFSLRRKSAHEP